LITKAHGHKRLQTGEAGCSMEPVADAEHAGTDGRAEKGAEQRIIFRRSCSSVFVGDR